MTRCPFAEWKPLTGPSGPFVVGPFKIVHHTTECSTAERAFESFLLNRSDPHFTVDFRTIYQHIEIDQFARSLRHVPPGPETNRGSAIQMEAVGFAHLPKGAGALRNIARLCRWIESAREIPRVWPSGYPKPAVNGHDPGGHNRDVASWQNLGGHFGHCHVPENIHWDPGYTIEEVNFLGSVTFDGQFHSYRSSRWHDLEAELPKLNPEALQSAVSTMADHASSSGD
jgi:hypothetical protein